MIDLTAVFDAILMGRKVQCLYGKPMANNFFQKWNFIQFVNRNVKVICRQKIVFTKFEGFSLARRRSFYFCDFLYICL